MTAQRETRPEREEHHLASLIAETVMERSTGMVQPFLVSFDPSCSFCRKNRQIFRVNEEFEHPEPTFIKRMPVSVAALSYDQTYRGRSVVILRDHETDLNQFMKTKQAMFVAFMEDVSAVADAIEGVCAPARVNYAFYMNTNVHLHAHLIPRYAVEGPAIHEPPFFNKIEVQDPEYDYRSLAMKIRKGINHRPSGLDTYCEALIDRGLPP
jgi:diadenosine tetraphosphate (Ap4A) HIT family hydrolase